MKMQNVIDILQGKAVKRGIDIKAFEFGTVEPAAGSTVRQIVTLRSGISKDKSKALWRRSSRSAQSDARNIKTSKCASPARTKTTCRKSSPTLKAMDFELPLQFVNYR